ncbi:hypothetical protein LTR36_004032 [Oleoguttula mirabilis]|uniref:MUC1 Extracellular alpha-1,4-glucan glucosidase n=1 Tax=Oleoguttula mirabilis TaxID=1507867 RepID=A0AAV9JJU9_9PEZI|nr:hypothetical protein LTR36_004032 [Oleoguttula mirabilis]
MFSRRRGSSNPAVDRATMNAATAAAAGAYLQNAKSNASLSSSAAAAALRSQTASPEPVGSLVTKRMARRGSVSSVGSGSVMGSGARGGVGRGGLQRQNSGGSMTERTFRSPSPGRSHDAVSPSPDAPPVPALPKNIPSGHKRSASLEPPQRITSPSPTPNGRSGRGSSVDRSSMPPPATSRQAKRLSNVHEAPPELERQNSNNNVNFSRPMSSLGNSPVTATSAGAKKYTNGTGSWFSEAGGSGSPANARPTTSDGLPAQRATAGFVQQDIQNAANKLVKKKRGTAVAEGSHLAQANKDAGAAYEGNQGTSYETGDTIMVFDPSSRTFIARPRDKPKEPEPPSPILLQSAAPAPGSYDPHTRRIVPGGQPTAAGTSDVSYSEIPLKMKKQRPAPPPVETTLQPPPRNPSRNSPSASPTSPRAAGVLHKQPSVVREDPEAEEAAAASSPISSILKSTGRTIQTSAGPAKMYVAPGGAPHQRSASLDVPRQSIEGGRGRNVSSSPARSAHFSPSPVMEAVRHDPPPRSISPVKSAMKHSPSSSVRTSSPMATFSPNGPKVPPSDASDTASLASVDAVMSPRKKKGVRVSFDETPERIEPAGAVAQPKAITRERSPVVDDEMEELMRPRPALPSFGSVRRSSGRAPEMAEKVTEMPPERQESSNDHAIGGILSNNLASKRGANEPVAPEVTSKEDVGYPSDESDDDFAPQPSIATAEPEAEEPKLEKADASEPKTRDFATETARRFAPESHDNGDVPAINLLPPTPGEEVGRPLGEEEPAVETSPRAKASWEAFNIPGSWAYSDDKDVAAEPQRSVNSAPVASGKSEASKPEEPATLKVGTSAATSAPEPQRPLPPNLGAIDEDSDDSAAFSDAEEDLSYLDDGGFASLDAIAVSPIAPPSTDKGKAPAAPAIDFPDRPTTAQAARKIHQAQASGDWGEATAYWSKLTRNQREQMEREHLSSDDEAKPAVVAVKKVRKKKSVPSQITAADAPVQPRSVQPVGSQTAMPKTMRARQGPGPGPAPAPAPASGDGDVHMRRSMRDGRAGGGGMASSLRSGPPPQQRPQSEYEPRSASQNNSSQPRPNSSGGPQLGSNGLPASAGGAAMRQRMGSDALSKSQESAFPPMQANRTPQQPQQRMQPGAPAGAFTNKLQKQVTNDSDSESSFRKKRRPSVSTVDTSGRYSMKRSMRAGSIGQASIDQRPTSPTPAAKRGGGAFSIRSLSPAASMFSNRGRGEKLRESLRSGSVDAAAAGPKRTTLRSGQPPPPRGGFGQSARPSTASAAAPSKPRFKSRFGDSDDEDEKPGRSFFRSRFADSDDDEPSSPRVMQADLTPVRGIPRRQGQHDGDSTDLESEDEEPRTAASRGRGKAMVTRQADVEKAMEAARKKLGIPAATDNNTPREANAKAGGAALSQGTLRKPAAVAGEEQQQQPEPKSRPEDLLLINEAPKKRGGFMGSILRRNRNSTQSVQQVAPSSPAAQASPTQPQVPALLPQQASPTPDASSSIPSSPSVGKLVRRSSQQPPTMRRGDSTFSTATAPPPGSAAGSSSENWPLPPVPKMTANGITNGSEYRPNTSDGVSPEAIKLARTLRPDLTPRSQSGNGSPLGNRVRIAAGAKEEDGGSVVGVGDAAKGVYSARTGRKKRFPMLRRAFGLND